MFKKALITTAIFAACANMAFADAAPYIGAKLGFHSTTGSLKPEVGAKVNTKAGQGVDGGVFAGFGGDIDQHFYLGAEVFGDVQANSNASKKNVNAGTVTVKSKYSYGASLVPGVKFGQSSMVYGKAGFVRSRFDVVAQSSGSDSQTAHRNATGGQLGVGVQTEVSKNVGVRAEFVHTAYKDFKAFNNTFSLKDNQVNVGVFYKFD